jgi:glycosyltransferase involved in cell wall biosynthesis
MTEKIKLHWVDSAQNPYGNILGYATHNKMMKKYSAPYFDYDETAKLMLHITPADHFFPFKDKTNILFTMWEFDELPISYIKRLKYADMIIVPSSYCRDVFQKHYNKKIEVCWEGVEPELYPYKPRTYPKAGEKFRILWLGAPNPRKGYHLVQELIRVIERFPNVEIYIKTTMAKSTWRYAIKYFIKNWRKICIEDGKWIPLKRIWLKIPTPLLHNSFKQYGEHKNVIFDTRRLPYEDMKNLYYSAHLFIFPSLGEGWGLPLSEAMATGCPCVGIDYTGCKDFFNEDVGYTLKHNSFKDVLTNYDNLIVEIRTPDTKDFIEKVIYVIGHYDEALKKAKKASDRIHSKFTWAHSGARLSEIIRREYAGR